MHCRHQQRQRKARNAPRKPPTIPTIQCTVSLIPSNDLWLNYRVFCRSHEVLYLGMEVVGRQFPVVAQPLLSEGKFVVMSPVVAQVTVALIVSLTHLGTKYFQSFCYINISCFDENISIPRQNISCLMKIFWYFLTSQT